jgi:hypothetical protein
MFSVVSHESNPASSPRLADVQLRRALLGRVHIQRRDAFRVLRHRGKETTLASADFKHMTGQRQSPRENKLEARRRVVAEAAKQCLALPHGALFADSFSL